MAKFLKDNGLTLVLFALFLASLVGHWLTGWQFQNEELSRHGEGVLSPLQYASDPQFIATVFENWESEFLQMSAYVVLTAFLFQRGSAESADPDKPPRDANVSVEAEVPKAAVSLRRGTARQWIYAHSLALALFLMFIAAFAMHWIFSAKEAAAEAGSHGEPSLSTAQYLTSAQLWFESFQNWQSEFLSTAVLVVLSIVLRQKNSPESKPLTAPLSQTGP